MYVSYTAAHWPMHALPEDIEKYEGWYDEGYETVRRQRLERMIELGILPPETEMSPVEWDWEERPYQQWESDMMEVYAAMIDCMDQGIGKIVKELERQGRVKNTLILFLQDNGACAENWLNNIDPAVYETITYQPMAEDELQPKIWPPMQTRDGRPVICGPTVAPGPDNSYPLYDKGWANVSNTPFRFYKHWIHEGGISTPLIVHWPDGIAAKGKITRQLGQLPDIMATIVDAAGAHYPEIHSDNDIYPMEGVSLIPAFDGEEFEHPPLFWEHIGKQGVRVDNWKLVAAAGRKDPIPLDSWELYDISIDRSELHNLASEYPERVREMAQMWADWAIRAKVVPFNAE